MRIRPALPSRVLVCCAVVVVLGLSSLTGCSRGGDDQAAPSSTSSSSTTSTSSSTTTSTTTTTAPTTTTVDAAAALGLPPVTWPAVPALAGPVVQTNTGVVAVATGGGAGGTPWTIETPCDGTATVPATPLSGAHVVLDPGHGGAERGAVGPNGAQEKDVNFAIALEAKRILEASGATVVLTRTADYRITLTARAEIVKKLNPLAFVSIHHNAEPDGPSAKPGNESFYQVQSASSKRLAGLLWEELQSQFTPFGARGVTWVADTDAGAKWRTNSRGGDYYGILRQTAGVTSVLSEAAFISNAPEADLLVTSEFQRAEALAIARAVVRYVGSADPGSGFTTPYPRVTPAGPGGGSSGCVDPPLS